MPSPPLPPAAAERLARLVAQTLRLHALTAHLSTALYVEDVAQIVVDEGTSVFDAGSGAMWRSDNTTRELVLVRARQYSEAALASVARLPLDAPSPVTDAARRGEPVWLSSRVDYEQRYPESAARTRTMQPGGYSVAALPIMFGGHVLGVLALTFPHERGFAEDERAYLTFLALHCAQGFERARLYGDAEAAKERAQFLTKASAVLGSSLDYEQTLANVANLAVPKIGEWCGVDLVDEDGALRQVGVAHVDPAKVELARQLRDRYPPDMSSAQGVPNVLRTGTSELYPEIGDAMLVAGTNDAEHLQIIRELGMRSAMVVPIKDRERVVGAISFVASDRSYTTDDLLMAEQLGERAGAAITNAGLYSSARDAIRLRDEFLLVAGHELRTPIAALSLHHEALIATPDGTPLAKIRERGVKLYAQTVRLARLVEELLDVSRLSANRLTLELETFDLGALAHEIIGRMRDELERTQTTVTLVIDEVIGTWDKGRMDQVITNLLTNAHKYGRGMPITVQVRRDGETAEITVADRGIGIAPGDQPRIFQRFERAVSSRKFSGLGLGLWITSQLVEAHGGAVSVRSELGEGSAFKVRVPLTRG